MLEEVSKPLVTKRERACLGTPRGRRHLTGSAFDVA